MKKIFLFLISILLSVPSLADDLRPAAENVAVGQYKNFWKTETLDPMNHVVWKLYVFRTIPKRSNDKGPPEFIIAGLTPHPKDHYFVRLGINEMYNFLKPIPKRGDVIVAAGRITAHRDYSAALPQKDVALKILILEMDGASVLAGEHFDPAASPTP